MGHPKNALAFFGLSQTLPACSLRRIEALKLRSRNGYRHFAPLFDFWLRQMLRALLFAPFGQKRKEKNPALREQKKKGYIKMTAFFFCEGAQGSFLFFCWDEFSHKRLFFSLKYLKRKNSQELRLFSDFRKEQNKCFVGERDKKIVKI